MLKTITAGIAITVLSATLTSPAVFADIAIIGNKAITTTSITKNTAKRIWLGKTTKLSGAGKIKILDQADDSAIKKNFYKKVTNKNSSQVKARWAKVIFTGKALPPKVVAGDEEVMDAVRNNTNVLGYIDSNSVDDSVKVLLTIK